MNITWFRGSNQAFSPLFSYKEFECKCCSCKEQTINKDLIDRLHSVRFAFNKPLRITSAFRCKAYQKHLKESGYETATGVSQHELGEAVDILIADYDDNTKNLLIKILKQHFKSVGVSNTFIHVDTRMDKLRYWEYKKG